MLSATVRRWFGPAAATAGLLALGRVRLPARAGTAVAAIGLVAVLAGPAAYALDPAATPHTGAIPSAGPAVAGARFGPGGGPGRAFGRGLPGLPPGGFPGVGQPQGGFPGGGGQAGGMPGGGSGTAQQIAAWVADHFPATTVGGVTIYDLTASTAAT